MNYHHQFLNYLFTSLKLKKACTSNKKLLQIGKPNNFKDIITLIKVLHLKNIDIMK